jgi:hypothetical protein
MWVLAADGSGEPVPLGHKISEGVAISRTQPKIAWSNTHGQYPDVLAEGESVIYTADIVKERGRPALAQKNDRRERNRRSGPGDPCPRAAWQRTGSSRWAAPRRHTPSRRRPRWRGRPTRWPAAARST